MLEKSGQEETVDFFSGRQTGQDEPGTGI